MSPRLLIPLLLLGLMRLALGGRSQGQPRGEGTPYLDLAFTQCAYDWPLYLRVEGLGKRICRLANSWLYWEVRSGEGAACGGWSPWIALRPEVLLRSRDCRRGVVSWIEWEAWPHGQRLFPEGPAGTGAEGVLTREEWDLLREVSGYLGAGLFWVDLELLLPEFPEEKECGDWSDWVWVREDLWVRSRTCSAKLEGEKIEWIQWESR